MADIFFTVLAGSKMVAIFTHNADRYKKAVILLPGVRGTIQEGGHFLLGAGMFKMAAIFLHGKGRYNTAATDSMTSTRVLPFNP